MEQQGLDSGAPQQQQQNNTKQKRPPVYELGKEGHYGTRPLALAVFHKRDPLFDSKC